MKVWLPTVRAGSGSDVFVERLATALARRGHEPIVQWFPHMTELVAWRLRNVETPAGVDVIHAASWNAFAFAGRGIPLVVTEHFYIADPDFFPYRNRAQSFYHWLLIRRFLRRSMQAADAIVAVSHMTANAVRKDAGKKISVIHNWIDTDQFRPSSVSLAEGRPFRLLFVGNPSVWKGSDVPAALAERLGDDFEVRCLGGLRKNASATSSLANFRVLSRVPPFEMPLLYQDVDAVLVPSRYEAFGYVALEAMACGKPVVGFASGGVSEVCRNGETALLVAVDDLDSLVDACRRLRDNPALCAELGHRGRVRAVSEFNEEVGVGAYLDLYRSMVERNEQR